jgi:hypothetical protein
MSSCRPWARATPSQVSGSIETNLLIAFELFIAYKYTDINPKYGRQYMLRVIEVKSAEGGADAQMFVKDLADAYTRLFSRFG